MKTMTTKKILTTSNDDDYDVYDVDNNENWR